MTVGLFIPCYVDQFYPQVAIATLQLLEKLGVTIAYPMGKLAVGNRWRMRVTNILQKNEMIYLYKTFRNSTTSFALPVAVLYI